MVLVYPRGGAPAGRAWLVRVVRDGRLKACSEMETRALSNVAFAFVCGLYFACLLAVQLFLLLEAHLSSQYLACFVMLFFWLC